MRKRRQFNIRNERDRTKRSVATEEEKQRNSKNDGELQGEQSSVMKTAKEANTAASFAMITDRCFQRPLP